MCRSTVYLLLLVTAAAMLLSAVYLILTRMFTRMIMHITLVLSIALNMYGLFFATLSICLTEASPLQRHMCLLLDHEILLWVAGLQHAKCF